MVCDKTDHHPMDAQLKADDYFIPRISVDTTNNLLTSRAGLLDCSLNDVVSLNERINQHFPQPKSNRGFQPA